MNVSTDELLLLLGAKEAELYALRRRIAELEAHLHATTPQPAQEENPDATAP